MRPIKTRPRFHCDFCSYTSSSVSGMTAHERRCWANPNRICDPCKNTGIMKHDGIALRYGNTELTPTLTNGIFLWLTQRNGMMDCEQIKVRWEALKSAWDALNGPEAFPGEHYAHEDDVQAALEAVENDVDALLAAIDELTGSVDGGFTEARTA